MKARRTHFEGQRDLALLTAYYGGMLSQIDWVKARIPTNFNDWRDQLTQPPVRVTAADRLAAFQALADAGYDVTVKTIQR